MNRTTIFVAFACLGGIAMIGTVVLLLHRPDATATFTTFVGLILSQVVIAATTFYGFRKTGEDLKEVKQQTNGNLSRRDAQIDALIAHSIANGVDPRPALKQMEGYNHDRH